MWDQKDWAGEGIPRPIDAPTYFGNQGLPLCCGYGVPQFAPAISGSGQLNDTCLMDCASVADELWDSQTPLVAHIPPGIGLPARSRGSTIELLPTSGYPYDLWYGVAEWQNIDNVNYTVTVYALLGEFGDRSGNLCWGCRRSLCSSKLYDISG